MTVVSAPTSDWREERRQDRMASAQIARENEAARMQARIARQEAEARLRREERQTRATDRRTVLRQRASRRVERMTWLQTHLLDLLFVPVIGVPAGLAWTAMAAFGDQVFGPAGFALPAFSEGAMWAFAAATTITRYRHPDRPVWHLRAGTALFAAVGAALNFIHGVIPVAGQLRGPGPGVVMALVSVAGVVAHQIVTAGPRRTRADRDAARLARALRRRERRIRRAAASRAVAELDTDGRVRLVYRPGAVTLTRRHFRVRMEDAPVPAPLTSPWPRPVPVLPPAGAASGSASADAPGVHLAIPPRVHPEGASAMRPVPAPASPGAAVPAPGYRTRKGGRRGTAEEAAEAYFAADLAAGRVPSARRIQRELHVGQQKAGELHKQMVDRLHRERGVVPLERRQA